MQLHAPFFNYFSKNKQFLKLIYLFQNKLKEINK